MSSDIKLNSIRLLVEDLPACLAFYRDVLGLEVTFDSEDHIYAQLIGEGVSLGLYGRDRMADVVGNQAASNDRSAKDTALLVFEVENVDESVNELKQKGVSFEKDAHDQEAWYMRVAYLRDPDGNLIEIFHSLYEGND